MFNQILISKVYLKNNIKQAKLNNLGSKICAMVKADAYGLGLKAVVSQINTYADYYGVACFFEAKKLEKLTQKPILIVGAFEKRKPSIRFEYMCEDEDDIGYLAKFNLPIKIHIKVNTGMNRYGTKSKFELARMLRSIKESKLKLVGLFTHFATSDEMVKSQMKTFETYVNIVKKDYPDIIVHADNSVINRLYNHHLSMARIGFDLYNQNCSKFISPVEIWSTIVRVVDVEAGEYVGYDKRFMAKQDMKVAIVPVGYADGFSLLYKGLILFVEENKCQVLNVCMDCFMLDVSTTNLKKGDKICLLNKSNPLSNYSKHSGFSEYEVMTNFSKMRADRKLISSVAHNDCNKSNQRQ